MNIKIKKTLKNLDLLITQRLLKKNKFFVLFFKSNKQNLKIKDIYFFRKNKYPLILLTFTEFNSLLMFSKINKKNIVLINLSNFIYKSYNTLIKYLDFQKFFLFLFNKNLIFIKQLKILNLHTLSSFKIFNFVLTNKQN